MNVHDSLVGSVVDGRYAIASLIGRGGMAAVYRARDKRLERDIAIKLMHPHLAEKPELNARFNKEARAAARLASPYLVAIHDQGVWASPDGPRAYLVMEYVPGPDARSELQRHGSFSLGTTLALVEQVLKALQAAHDAGIVHRDVKPENVLLACAIAESDVARPSEVHAKVADFGLAHVIDADSAPTGTMLGTVAYIPPEAIGSGRFAPPADLYSLGIMTYEFLTGILPFRGGTPMQTAFKHMNEPMPRAGDQADWLPPEIDSFIARLTAKNPEDRPADARQALVEFKRMRGSVDDALLVRRIPIVAPQPPQPSASPEPPVRHPEPTAPYGRHERIPEPSAAVVATSAAATAAQAPAPGNEAAGVRTRATSRLPAPAEATGPDAHGNGSGTVPAPASAQARAAGLAQARQLTAIDPKPAGASQFPPARGAVPRRRAAPPAASRSPAAPDSGSASAAAGRSRAEARQKRRRWPAVLLVFALLGVAASGSAWYFLDGPGRKAEVPAVVGESGERARSLLEAAGFVVETTEAYSDDVTEGVVISSSPDQGVLKIGSPVTVVVSLGIEQVAVPNIVSMTADEAAQALRSARLEPRPDEEYSETVETGRVVSQSIAAKSLVDHDSPVGYTVSKGRQPIEIPAVAGMKREEAVSAIEGAGLAVSASEAYSDTVPRGNVVSQEPSEGTAFRGDRIGIVVSKGPETVQVPDVTDLSVDEAKRKIEESGLKVDESRPFGISHFERVWMQDPTSGTTVKKGSSVKITII